MPSKTRARRRSDRQGRTIAALLLGCISLVATLLAGTSASLCRAADLAPRRTENVILITTDGLRWQEVFTGAEEQLISKELGNVEDVDVVKAAFWRDDPQERRKLLMPFLWSTIADEGQIYGNGDRGSIARLTNGKKFSYPGYNEMLAGFPDARIDSNAKRPNPNVNVLEWLNGWPRFHGRVAAFTSWDCFPFIINRERSGVFVNSAWEPVDDNDLTPRQELLNQLLAEIPRDDSGARPDALTFHCGMEYLKKHQPRVLYLSFDETDHFAHDGEYDQYLTSARRVDQYLATIWETLQDMPQYRGKTSLVITTDHGRGNDPPIKWRDHGADVGGAEYIWIAALGPDTPALGERANVPEVTQAQVAATVAALLGEDYAAAVPKVARPIADVVGSTVAPAR